MVEVFVDEVMTTAREHPFLGGDAVVFSTRSPEKDTANEDAAALIAFEAGSGIAVVCDGAGGIPGGEQASRIALRELQREIESAAGTGLTLRMAVLNGLEAANRAILALGQGSGTTSAIVGIQGDAVRPYHVGDSMILIVGQRGRLKHQSISHSPVGFAVESGMIDESEAVHHEDRHLVSNLVGTADMSIEIGPKLRLAARDTVLIATDGVFDNLYPDEVIAIVRKGPLREAGAKLAAATLARMTGREQGKPCKPDDLTFILYRRRKGD